MGTRWKQDASKEAVALVRPGDSGGLARGIAVRRGDMVRLGISFEGRVGRIWGTDGG